MDRSRIGSVSPRRISGASSVSGYFSDERDCGRASFSQVREALKKVFTLQKNKRFILDEMTKRNLPWSTNVKIDCTRAFIREKIKQHKKKNWLSYSKNMENFDAFHIGHFIKHQLYISEE